MKIINAFRASIRMDEWLSEEEMAAVVDDVSFNMALDLAIYRREEFLSKFCLFVVLPIFASLAVVACLVLP